MTLTLRPPRRDPRPLVVRSSGATLAYAAVDAWELRGHGVLCETRLRDLTLALRRLVLQIKPTTIIAAIDTASPRRITRALSKVAALSRVQLVQLGATTTSALLRGAPSLAEIAAQYPEVSVLASADPSEVVRLAVRCLTHLALPSRFYAPRHAPRAEAPVASCGAHGSRSSRGALAATARRPRR